MRWFGLVLLAACAPETGVVHDGDTDVVMVQKYEEGDCGGYNGHVEVMWEVPDMARDITVTLCDKEHVDDTGGERCNTKRAEDMMRSEYPPQPAIMDGYLWFECGGYYPTTWRIDYTAPRP